MPVDVVTTIVIARPRAEVAAFAADPDNATRWYQNIRSVEWQTPRPVALGTRMTLRNSGGPCRKDLERLKAILEG